MYDAVRRPPDTDGHTPKKRWLHCGAKAVAVVAFHNDVWRSTVNRHLDIKRERSAPAPTEELATAWVERWAVAHAERIRREVLPS